MEGVGEGGRVTGGGRAELGREGGRAGGREQGFEGGRSVAARRARSVLRLGRNGRNGQIGRIGQNDAYWSNGPTLARSVPRRRFAA